MDTLTLARDFASLLLDTAAKGTALLLLAVLATWLCRRSSAALRHSIWCMTMGGLLLLPVASWALPAWQIPILPPEPIVAPAPAVAEVVRLSPPSPAQGATGEGLDSPVLRHSTAGATVLGHDTFKDTGGPGRPPVAPSAAPVVEPTPAPARVQAAPPLTAIEWTALLVSTLWSLGVSLFGVLLLVGLWRTVQLRRASLIVHEGEWPVMLVELRQRLGLSRSVELREHAQSVVPLTWGIWRPVVLLPKLARAWDEPMRRAVLLHELAHVQRGDVACQVLGRLTCVLYWFHPLAWFALRQLRQEREQACDDAVVQSGEKASDYAEQLLEVARLCCAPRGLSLGVAMAEGSSLERRVKSLFDSARSHGPVRRAVALALLIVGVLSVGSIAMVQPVSISADEPTPVPPVTSPVVPVSDKAATTDQLIQGIVVDSQGRPVGEAIVWCDVDQDKATRQPITARVETNAQGEFRFSVPKSSLDYGQGHFQHAAWAWKQGHGIGVGVAVASTRMPKNPEARLSLPETSAVTLQVVDEKGEPVAGAEVSPKRVLASQVPGMPQDGPFSMVVLPPKELLGIATRKTDAEGRVTLDLVPRRYLQNVQVNSASHGEQSFSYYADVLKLNAVTSVEGELSNHQAGVRLSLRTSQTRPQTEKPGPREIISADVQVVTDTQGRFTVPILPVGEFTIASEELNGPQFLKASSQKGVLVAGQVNKVSLDIVTGIPVKGRVTVRGEQLGVKNAVVNVGTYSEFESGPVCTVYSKTDEKGEYTSYTLPGHSTISELSSVGDDATLIHPRIGGAPVSFQKPIINPEDATEVVLPEIAVDRGQNWLGKLVDEEDVPIDGVYIMPTLRGKQLFMPLPTQQGGVFGFQLLKGVTPDAWMVLTDVQDDSVPPMPTQVVSKNPLVLKTKRVAPPERDPDQPDSSWSPYGLDQNMNNITAEEIEESQAVSSGFPELLKQAGLTEEEIASFNTVGPTEFSGVILDATTHQPIVGAVVDFMCLGPKAKVTTNEKGLFRVQGLPPGMPAIATIKKEGYAPRGVVRQQGEQDWLILLDNQTCFEGVITDAAGKPVADAIVRATWEFPVFGDEPGGLPLETETKSKADGAYRLPVPSSLPNGGGGNQWHNEGHEIQVVVPGRGSARKEENYIAYRSHEQLPLQLTPSVRFEVKIVDSVTQEPVPGFVLYTTEKPFYMGRSDAAGRLVIDDLLPGKVWFNIGEGEAVASSDCEGCEESASYKHLLYSRCWSPDVPSDKEWRGQKLHVPEGDKLQENFGSLRYDLKPDMPVHTLYVEKSATISGRVTDPDGHPVEGASVVCIRSGGTLRDHEKTDKDGRYVLYLPASKNAKYNLMVHDGELQQTRNWANGVSASLQTTPGQTVENFDLQLSRPGSVQGRVIRKGQPVGNYTVRTVACDQLDDRYHFTPTTKTKADGTFELPLVRPGKHFLQAGFEHRSKDDDQGPVIEVVAGETVADQILEAQPQPDPEEGLIPEPTPADMAPAAPEKEPMPVGQNDKTPKVGDVTPVGKKFMLQEGNGNSITAITGDIEITLDLDKVVWWGEPVDGLEPGFWLTKSEDPRNLRIPMDSLVNYRVVVRNTTDKEIEFLVRLLPFDDQDVPYLIPSDKLDPKGRIVPPQPAKEFQAQGAANVLDGINAARIITLAAGESVLFPGEERLYVGKTDDIYIPRISDFVPGTHWIVQPLLVHPLSDKERAELNRQLSEVKVTKIDRSGKTRQEPVVLVEAPDNSKGKFAYAKYHLEVGTLDASADRNAKAAIWGEVEQGMQCGIRLLNPQPSYKIGDTLEAELLWRNTSEAVISTTRPRPLDLYPSIEDAEGNHKLIDFGARYDLPPGGYDFEPSEVRSLGVTKVTLVAQGTPGPKDNKEPGHITLEPGKYKLSASGGVGNISPRSGKYEFTVAAPEAPQPPVVAPTKSEMTQFAPNIPQTRPNLLRAPTPAEPRPVVDMKRELLQRLARGGKISTDSLSTMITLVSSEGAYDWEFISVILAKFDKSCEPKSELSKQNLLAVLTNILEIHGSSRWQEPESGPDSKPQAVIPDDTESLSRLTSEILEHLIDQGGKADRSDIDAFVMALRQAHHADGKEFLRLVLQNPEVNAPSTQKPGLWVDNMGGSWPEAKFHAAVALAELKDPDGVERLIDFARPNDFGLDESLFSRPHSRDASGSRRASSVYALIDLFGLKADADFKQIEAWWKANQGQFQPKRVALGRAAGIP